jgi:hypothetical protein
MNLYRAISVSELKDLHAHGGRFRDSIHQSGEKGFFFEQEDAVKLAASLTLIDGESHVVVMTEASDEIVSAGRPHCAAQEGPGVYLNADVLDGLAPAIEVKL